jgi:malate synthase
VKCNGEQIPEGILDAFVTAAAGALSIQVSPLPEHRNSRVGSIYLVKPKLQGSDEVRFTNALFDRVEDALKLHRNTIKVYSFQL